MPVDPDVFTVVLTRTPADNAMLGDALHGHFKETWGVDLRCIGFATSRVQTLADVDRGELNDQVTAADALAFTSRHGVRAALELLGAGRLLDAHMRGMLIACVGPRSAAELAAAGVTVDVVADPSTAQALGDALVARLSAGATVLVMCGDQARPELSATLLAGGISALQSVVYSNEDALEATRASASALVLTGPQLPSPQPATLAKLADAVVFFAPSAAARTLAAIPAMRDVSAVAIGPTTASALREIHGITPAAVADTPTISGLAAALARALGLGQFEQPPSELP